MTELDGQGSSDSTNIYYRKSYSKYSKKYKRNRNLTSTHT